MAWEASDAVFSQLDTHVQEEKNGGGGVKKKGMHDE